MPGEHKYRLSILLALALGSAPHAMAEIVLSTPGGVQVTQDDVERYIVENVPAEKRESVLTRAGFFPEMAESLYVLRTLAVEAEAMPGFDKEQAAWAAKMKHQRRVVADYRIAYVRDQLKTVDWEAAAKETYLVDRERYMTPEKVRASHILITTENRSEEEALELATELRARAVAGEDFAALAVEYSDDPSSEKNSGNLGLFGRGQMVEPFENAVFAMNEKGEISELVKSPFGYHIILFVDRVPAEQISFEDAKEKIIEGIQVSRGNQVWQDKIIATRSAPGIQINEERLQETRAKFVAAESEPAVAPVSE